MKTLIITLLLPVLLFSCKDEKKLKTFIVCSGGICDTIELIGMDTANFTIINDSLIGWDEIDSVQIDTIYVDAPPLGIETMQRDSDDSTIIICHPNPDSAISVRHLYLPKHQQ